MVAANAAPKFGTTYQKIFIGVDRNNEIILNIKYMYKIDKYFIPMLIKVNISEILIFTRKLYIEMLGYLI